MTPIYLRDLHNNNVIEEIPRIKIFKDTRERINKKFQAIGEFF